jgi:methylase of polypeptide subunit release factors
MPKMVKLNRETKYSTKFLKMKFSRVPNRIRRLTHQPSIFKAGKIKVFYHVDHDGGGTSFGQDFIKLFNYLNFQPKGRVLEWCGGPGFIGFRIYDSYNVDSVVFSDINLSLIKNFNRTLKKNRLQNISYFIGHLNTMPKQKFDLIVANPPHFPNKNDYPQAKVERQRLIDENWNIHKVFFENINNFMSPNSTLILQENKKASSPEIFEQLMQNTPISLKKIVFGKEIGGNENIYYLICNVRPQGFEPRTF